MTTCTQCGAAVVEGTAFCVKCGAPLGGVPAAPAAGAPVFRCPFCQAQGQPVMRQKISTAGWVTFAILLVFCLPLFWIGLLIKEDYRVCGTCGTPL